MGVMTARARTPLAPIVVTDRAGRVIAGESGAVAPSEIWAARTADGAWELVREDARGTPWAAIRAADKGHGGSYGTLRAARAAIASGAADVEARVHLAGERARQAAKDAGLDWRGVEDATYRGRAAEWDAIRAERAAGKAAA